MKQARLAIVLTLMYRIHPQVAGLAFGVGLAPLGNGHLAALGVLHAHPVPSIDLGMAHVVYVRNRDTRQGLVLRIAENLELALQYVAGSRPGQILVSGVHRGQQRNIGVGVPPGKIGPLGWLSAHPARPHPSGDEPRDLGPAQPADLHQKVPHHAALASGQTPVLLGLQQGLDKTIDGGLAFEGQDHLPVALDELLHLGLTQPLQILHVNSHSPAGCPFSPRSYSGSPRIGNDFPFQAHAALETTSLSRLISHWTILWVAPRAVY